jgi:hypothetical protein
MTAPTHKLRVLGIGNMPCDDCGCPDNEMPCDTVLTGKQWILLCPEGVGTYLCASCIVKRAAKLPGVINVTARICFAEDYEGEKPGGRVFEFLKGLDGETWNAEKNEWEPMKSIA